jgi:hypothetical protein
MPALIPIHSGLDGTPDHFSGRQLLWNVVWWPALAFVILTFFPQVRVGQSFFWSSYQQQQLRWLVVGGVGLFLLIFLHNASKHGRELPDNSRHTTSK